MKKSRLLIEAHWLDHLHNISPLALPSHAATLNSTLAVCVRRPWSWHHRSGLRWQLRLNQPALPVRLLLAGRRKEAKKAFKLRKWSNCPCKIALATLQISSNDDGPKQHAAAPILEQNKETKGFVPISWLWCPSVKITAYFVLTYITLTQLWHNYNLWLCPCCSSC